MVPKTLWIYAPGEQILMFKKDHLPDYLAELIRSPRLKPEEEAALVLAAQEGDDAARIKLVEANMGLVVQIAKTYRNRTVPLQDRIQHGAVGLMRATERFDPDKGFRFSTYATHLIRQAINHAELP